MYLKVLKGNAMCNVETLEVDGRKDGFEPAEETEEVQVGSTKENTTRMDTSLSVDIREKLITFLCQNSDVFAWTLADMPDIPSKVITH